MSLVAIGANRPLLPKSALTTPAMSNAAGPVPCQPNGTTAIGTAASCRRVIVIVELRAPTAAHHRHAAATSAAHAQILRTATRCGSLVRLYGSKHYDSHTRTFANTKLSLTPQAGK